MLSKASRWIARPGIILVIALLWWLYNRVVRRLITSKPTRSVPTKVSSLDITKVTDAPPTETHRLVKQDTTSEKASLQEPKRTKREDEDEDVDVADNFVDEDDVATATAFLGFSILDDVEDGALVVDGLFRNGPAYKVGVCIDDQLTAINGEAVCDIQMARKLISMHCIPGEVASMLFRRPNGERFAVQLRVMTAEPRFSGNPFYFDPYTHEIEESGREKKLSWAWPSENLYLHR
ncbi:kinetoplast DNA-associated protein [Trypanosoma grayi]|uniref:kinetoplast DNA-associated protein n=1 Tax=Trypanosoma grayi TaxID=71804 RepID=UPI0004F43ED9|nr:kinetoplast DNA-associated protein [Trypanosoma grayi]KEG13999.1 kinetoplast DNA-associated protein [Trypanosoma grayi]